LAEAKELVETLPSKVLEGVSEPVSRAAKEKLEQAGAGVRLDMLPFG
jgi:ribosomal protein L7/L12